MPTEPGSDLRFESGRVLFIDIVGYSKLLMREQSEPLLADPAFQKLCEEKRQ